MKIACSSASFAREIGAGDLTLLDWLDLAANELELDGVVFDTEHFVRTDADYLAQMKKAAVDLGLTVAAVAASETDAEAALATAAALGAPLAIVRAPAVGDDATWGRFADALKSLARTAKAVNVTLAVHGAPGSLCASPGDLRRIAKDVDSSWLRFAFDPRRAGAADDTSGILAKTVIALATIERPAAFATDGDRDATELIARLARFRGFVCLDTSEPTRDGSFHRALERFAAKRENALVTSASSGIE